MLRADLEQAPTARPPLRKGDWISPSPHLLRLDSTWISR
jgi:hypothetical protein